MKKITTLILFSTFSCLVFGQENQVEFTAVVSVENTTAKELHERYLDWFNRTFSILGEVEMQAEDDKIIARPYLLYYPDFVYGSYSVRGTIAYTIEVDFDNGKFKYIINNFVHYGNPAAVGRPIDFGLITTEPKSPLKFPNQLYSERTWRDIKSHITSQIMPLIANLKTGMTKAPPKKED